MNRKYIIELSDEERQQLEQFLSSGIAPVRMQTRARILLKSDSREGSPNWSYEQLCAALDVTETTVARVRRDFVEGGLERALARKKPEREYERCLDGRAEAHLIALACSEAPQGYERWSLRLLQKRFIQLGYVDQVSHETIRTTLKKMNLSLG